MKPVTPWKFAELLVGAGVLTQDEANHASRVVIDCSMDTAVQVYVQRFGDLGSLAKLAPMLSGLLRAGEETAQIAPRKDAP